MSDEKTTTCNCRQDTIVRGAMIECSTCGKTWRPRRGFSDPAFEQGKGSEWDRAHHQTTNRGNEALPVPPSSGHYPNPQSTAPLVHVSEPCPARPYRHTSSLHQIECDIRRGGGGRAYQVILSYIQSRTSPA